MSTIYAFHAECSAIDSLASSDKLLVWDASTGRTLDCTPADIATYVGASGSFVSPTLSGSAVYSGTASVSFMIGTTLTSRIGFYGIAGTSQPANAAQAALTITVANPTTCTAVVGFSTTGQAVDLINLVVQMRACLVANGLMKGSS